MLEILTTWGKKNGFSVSFVKIEQKEALLNVARTVGILRDELFFIVVMLFQTATAEKQDKTVAFDTDTLSFKAIWSHQRNVGKIDPAQDYNSSFQTSFSIIASLQWFNTEYYHVF